MDPAPNISPNEPLNSEPDDSTAPIIVGEKRAADNGKPDEELVMKSPKRPRRGGAEKEAKRVAEIVLVLSAMWRMRGGGKNPTEAELGLMAEAREKLVEMCEDLAPKDIVARDAIVALIEDLGFNVKAKDQRLGFRGQRMNIKEKLEFSKRKMEESKTFITQPTTYTSHQLQPSFGTAAESRGTSHTVRMFPSDKMSHSPAISSGGFPTSSPPVHVSAAASTPLPYQLPTNEGRAPTVSTGLPSGHLGRDSSSLALPRVERAQIKLDGGPNGSSYVSQVRANPSANHPLVNAPTWSVHPQSASAAKHGPESKVPNHNPVKLEGTADMSRVAPQAARDQNFRPFITQTVSGNLPSLHQPSQGMNIVPAPPFCNNHNEIAKLIQKSLQPKLPEHPTWTPPSREYMNKTLTCQICRLTINEVETVLLCDACEKGFHLKCLQMIHPKAVRREAEWHCMSCLKLSNGKPLPPKYGRVMRSNNSLKMSSNTSVSQTPSDKKVGQMDPKVNHQKIIVNGSSAGSGTVDSNPVEVASGSEIQNARALQGNNFFSSTNDTDLETSSGTSLNSSTKSLGAVCDPTVASASERLIQPAQLCETSTDKEESHPEPKSQPPAILSEAISDSSDHSQPSHNPQVIPTDVPNHAEASSNNCHNSNCMAKQDEQDVPQPNPGSSGILSDILNGVDWIGDVFQFVDEKSYYQSCCIGGVTYKVQDHALLNSGHDKLIPSKIQAMWEDTSGSKWVMVNRCFFPGDLPEAVGCPCSPESSELYESNNDSTVMAGLIQGPCEVLPDTKFKEENERLSQLGTDSEADKGRRPVFLCKWFYDEIKGVFRPISG